MSTATAARTTGRRPSRLRSTLGTLTVRGRAFVAGGVTAALCGLALGERDLVRIGVLVLLIPVVTALVVARTGPRLSLTRTIAAPVVEVGQGTTVQLHLTNVGARTGLLLVEEQVPWALGHRPRFLIGWMQSGRKRLVQYPVQAEVRGIYEVGPLSVKVADPFGMLSLQRAFPRTTPLVVVPVVEPLPVIGPIGAWSGSGDNRPRPFSIGSAADTSVREYRLGDDLRRVHWRSTARTGELMVRREEQPWHSRCTLFIDNRAVAHRGSGPDSSLERAVTATASIAVHLSRLGFQVRLVSADGNELDHAWHDVPGGASTGPILEHLAALATTAETRISTPWIDEGGTGGLFIGVLGALDDHDRRVLGRLHTQGSSSYAVSLAVDSWSPRDRLAGDVTGTSTTYLRERGWKATDLNRADSLPAVWKELGR
ncbi:uncharacterized protein (DUF58 family) [Marmoricola sp. OAE513]|uniref:DUF58 domain-containing protein n=1 Tax=Marmoricola sp. OAE513 TaxID=2817894 RepID=UPI001AE16E42